MTRSIKRRVVGCLVVLLVGLVAANALAAWQAYAMLHYDDSGPRTMPPEQLSCWGKIKVMLTGMRMPRPRAVMAPDEVGLPFVELRIPAGTGVALSAWHIPQSNQADVMLLFHGYGAEKSSLLEEARLFHRLGYSIVMADFQGGGASTGRGTTLGFREAEDVKVVVDWVTTNLHPDHLLLYGQSMGAAAILRAMAHEGVQADGVILESLFDTVVQTVRNRFSAMKIPATPLAEWLILWGGWWTGYPAFSLNPVDDIKKVSCGVLVLHGADDARVRTAEAQRVFDAAPGPKWWKEINGAGHESLASHSPVEWQQAIGDFCRSATMTQEWVR